MVDLMSLDPSRATDETLRNVLLDLAREWDRTAHLTEATLLLSD